MKRDKPYQLTKDKFLSKAEQLLLEAYLSANRDCRNALIIELALATGGRESELLAIRPQDLIEGCVYIIGLKGSLDRTIPLKKQLYQRLLKQAEGLLPHQPIFAIKARRLRQIWHDVRPVLKKFHSLRHTFGLNFYEKSKDLRLTQIALGHTNVQNTMRYAHVSDSLAQLKKVLL